MENETSGLLAIKYDVNHSYVAPQIPNEIFSLRRSTSLWFFLWQIKMAHKGLISSWLSIWRNTAYQLIIIKFKRSLSRSHPLDESCS